MNKCNNCGSISDEENKFCNFCGTYLNNQIKIYPNCSVCKWLDGEAFNWRTCNAQGWRNIKNCYGTKDCHGVYEKK